jgi:hypothetical protein
MEGFTKVSDSVVNAAPVSGGVRRRKLQLVTKKQARKMLKRLGKKLRGGGDAPVVVDGESGAPVAKMGGGKSRKKTRAASRRASVGRMFGL